MISVSFIAKKNRTYPELQPLRHKNEVLQLHLLCVEKRLFNGHVDERVLLELGLCERCDLLILVSGSLTIGRGKLRDEGCLRHLSLVGGAGGCVGAALARVGSLLLEHLLPILLPELHSVVLALPLELVPVVPSP